MAMRDRQAQKKVDYCKQHGICVTQYEEHKYQTRFSEFERKDEFERLLARNSDTRDPRFERREELRGLEFQKGQQEIEEWQNKTL